MVRIGAAKLPPVGVVAHAILCAARLHPEFIGDGIEPQIFTAEFLAWHFGMLEAGHNAAIAASSEDVDTIVDPPLKAVHEALNVEQFQTSADPCEDLFTHFCLAIAVLVFEAPDVWSGTNKESAICPNEPRRPGEIISKDGAGFKMAVAVFVLQHGDAPEVRSDISHL